MTPPSDRAAFVAKLMVFLVTEAETAVDNSNFDLAISITQILRGMFSDYPEIVEPLERIEQMVEQLRKLTPS